MLKVRRELVWDYPIPAEPERDDGFRALYVGRVLDRGTAADVRSLGLPLIRRLLDVAPCRREVLEFWRWWFAASGSQHGDPDRSTAEVPAGRRVGRAVPV